MMEDARMPAQPPPRQEETPSARMLPCRFLFPGVRSIRGKLLMTIGIVAGLGVIATLTASYALWRIEDKIRIIESFYELNQNVLEIRRYEKNYLLFNDKKDLLSALDHVVVGQDVAAGIKQKAGARSSHRDRLQKVADVLRAAGLDKESIESERLALFTKHGLVESVAAEGVAGLGGIGHHVALGQPAFRIFEISAKGNHSLVPQSLALQWIIAITMVITPSILNASIFENDEDLTSKEQ